MAVSKDEIQNLTQNNKVVVFSKSYCPYCTKTKTLFKDLGVSAKVLELDQMKDGDEYQKLLEQMTGQRTVPNVWVNNTFIGGNDDTQRKNKNGELSKLLA